MPVNTMSFNQASALLTAIVRQATGQDILQPTNTAEFVTIGQTALQTGYDPVLNAINQVLSRTYFSIRPYNRKFRGLEVSETEYGNHVRKIVIADKPISDDQRYLYPVGYDGGQTPPNGDGKSVDQYVLNKPDVLQTNFYGVNVFQDWYTLFRDQLNSAFTGPDQFGSFVSMVIQNNVDKLEQYRENAARATLAHMIGAVISEDNPDRVVHLLTEYNTLTGLSLTAETVWQPDNYKAFVQWMYGRVANISDLMTERSLQFQTVINGKPVMKHTPLRDQKVYLHSRFRRSMEQMAIADVYHDNYLRFADNEAVNFWQSIKSDMAINLDTSYIGPDGTIVTPDEPVAADNIVGVMFDREAIGYSTTQQWSAPTPFNAAGGYTNVWFHETFRAWYDGTEKAVVLMLN